MTDIEGSTALLREYGDSYGSILERHHRVVRGAAARHRAEELGEAGDGLTFVFPRADDALAAAMDLQEGLGGGPVHVRAVVHLGGIVTTAVGPIGMVLHECARLLTAASGGQVLVSPAARAALGQPPHDIQLHVVGPCRLRDIHEPWILSEAVPAGRAPLGTLRTPAWTMVASTPTSLVGRTAEIQRIVRSSVDRPLITLTGPGGIGKTRLAVEAAKVVAAGRGNDAAMAELAPVAAEGVPAAVLRAVRGGTEAHRGEPIDVVIDTLADRDAVLVLDNCEHVVDAAAELVDRLRRGCPGVTVLATSRKSLDLPGEVVVEVPLLDEQATVDLFVDRLADIDARSATVLARLRPTWPTSPPCLEGLPLAIELAAARARFVTAPELLDQLGRPLQMPRPVRSRGVSPATPACGPPWIGAGSSWVRPERALLQHLGLFTGWFEAGDAAQVWGTERLLDGRPCSIRSVRVRW